MGADSTPDGILSGIVAWCERQVDVRALILTGSRAREEWDDLSDFDVEMYVRNSKPYIESDRWMSEIKPVWVYLPLEDDMGYPTRLVIFDGGVKVDFSIYPVSLLEQNIVDKRLGPPYSRGYRVLLDKDSMTDKLSATSQQPPHSEQPGQRDFDNLVGEFWFEAYHVAKYLRRQDLWTAKFRDWGLKQLVLKTIEWYEKTVRGWNYDTHHDGIRMKEWIEPTIWDRVNKTFARFDVTDSWRALDETTALFRDLAGSVANQLNYRYPQEIDENLSRYIQSLKDGSE